MRRNGKNSIIRTTKHYFASFTNLSKRSMLSLFLKDANAALDFYVSYLWNNRVDFKTKNEIVILDIKNGQLNCPSFLPLTKNIKPINTLLSARVLQCIATQACGIIKSAIKYKRSLEYRRECLITEGKDITTIDKNIAKIVFSKPATNNIAIELNTRCANFIEKDNNYFNGFIKLSSLGKAYGSIYIPIKYTKRSNKWKQQGTLLKSFMISKSSVDFRWQIEIDQVEKGSILGFDTGLNTAVYCSDEQHTQKDIHNHDLNSITDKLARKKKGSKGFAAAQEHRKNYVNYSINQLNFTGVKEFHIENIFDLGRGKSSSRKMSHFKNSLIEKKLIAVAEELGVQVFWKSSFYKSQRCFCCGFVSEKNRNKEAFLCLNCGNSDHSDLNSAKNQTLDLPSTYLFKDRLKQEEAFFFQKNGFFLIDGSELTVPIAKEMKDSI